MDNPIDKNEVLPHKQDENEGKLIQEIVSPIKPRRKTEIWLDLGLVVAVLIVFLTLLNYGRIGKWLDNRAQNALDEKGEQTAQTQNSQSIDTTSNTALPDTEVSIAKEPPMPKISSVATQESFDGALSVIDKEKSDSDNDLILKSPDERPVVKTPSVMSRGFYCGEIRVSLQDQESSKVLSEQPLHCMVYETLTNAPVFEIYTQQLQSKIAAEEIYNFLSTRAQLISEAEDTYSFDQEDSRILIKFSEQSAVYYIDYSKTGWARVAQE